MVCLGLLLRRHRRRPGAEPSLSESTRPGPAASSHTLHAKALAPRSPPPTAPLLPEVPACSQSTLALMTQAGGVLIGVRRSGLIPGVSVGTNRYLVDASLVLSDVWLGWLEEEEDDKAFQGAVVSDALVVDLQERPERVFFPWLPEDHQHEYEVNRERALDLLERRGIGRFAYKPIDLPGEAGAIDASLRELNDPDVRILLDEWAFLMTQSWMASASTATVAALRRRGGTVIRIGRRFTHAIAAAVVPQAHIPEHFTPGFLAKVGAKWVVWATLGGVGTVGGAALGTLIAGPAGSLPGGGVGGVVVGAGTQAVFYEFDP
jgi:hypothetical protein